MSPRKIAEMSRGEVVNAQTFDVYTQKPIEGGLFCQQIFGPIELGTCQCGKYRRSRRAVVLRCETCNVDLADPIVRKRRFGHLTAIPPRKLDWLPFILRY